MKQLLRYLWLLRNVKSIDRKNRLLIDEINNVENEKYILELQLMRLEKELAYLKSKQP